MVLYKLVTHVPLPHADAVRQAIGQAGAGTIGNYTFCSFSSRGIGRYKPQPGAHPSIGNVGVLESVEEERIEVTCPKNLIPLVVDKIKAAHPYEEPTIDIYELSSSWK